MGTHKRPLNPMADIFIRYLLGSEKNKDILIDFINAVFMQKGHDLVVELEIRNPFNLAVFQGNKQSILDVKARDTRGRLLNVEVQIENKGNFAHRSLYYWAKNYSDQLESGNIYADLRPTICINLQNFEIFPQLPGYHSCFQIAEVDAPEFVLSEHLQIHFIEIPKDHLENIKEAKNQLETWIYFFKNEGILEDEAMTVLLKDNPVMEKAHQVYREFTANDELMDMVEAQEKWKKDVNTQLHDAETRGMKQARREDARKMLAKKYSISEIAEITGLSEQEIKEL